MMRPITELDIAAGILAKLEPCVLTQEDLVCYFEETKVLLRQNYSQATVKYGEEDISQIVKISFPNYLHDRGIILANYNRFIEARERIVERFSRTYGEGIPDMVLVPCIGFYTAGGWADYINGKHHIFIALERIPADLSLGVLLAHEIAHGISANTFGTVLDGFYNEGYATLVSSVIFPGYEEHTYFFNMDEELYARYLGWIYKHREKIQADCGKDFTVMDETHRLYFTTSYSDYPNIGYVIGYKFLSYLYKSHTLEALRNFGTETAELKQAFQTFISSFQV